MSMQTPKALQIGEDLVKEVDHGVIKTFSTMFGIMPVAGHHVFSHESLVKADISGFVGLAQARIEGVLVISFPQETIFAMLAKMYNKPFNEVDKSVRSGVGELTNIVFGVMKTNLNKNGFALKMAIPNVIFGDQHSVVTSVTEGKSFTIPYATDAGPFSVQLTLFPEASSEVA
jgi:chemotaxis protein CheX